MAAENGFQHWRWIIFVPVIFVCINLTQNQIFSADKELFPVPENLKPNVQFWKKVYTLYDSNQIIIHDANNLEIIYEIFDAEKFFGFADVSEKEKWQEVENVKTKYKKILQKLTKPKDIQPDSLKAQARYVYDLFKSSPSQLTFRMASQNIRGQQGLRNHFRISIIRSGQYISQIKQIFNKHNLPLELTALPHVESSFNYKAYSKFGAAGMWQFTRQTGRRFLKINYTLDERFDPIKSSEAAAKLFKDNYEKLGNWPLAITAYNHGVYGMMRAVNRLKTIDLGKIVDKYKSRSFKFASRNFYAEFIAAKEVQENYKSYFGDLEFEQPAKYLTFRVPNYVRISTLARRLDVSIEKIKELNPSLRKSVLTSKRRLPRGFELKIPYRDNFDPIAAYAQIPGKEKFQAQLATNWYQVQRGDNLNEIARRFKTTVFKLMALNEIDNPHQIYVGQVLKLKSENAEQADQAVPLVLAQNNEEKLDEKKGISNGWGEMFFVPHISEKPTKFDKVNNQSKNDLLAQSKNETAQIVDKKIASEILNKPYGKIAVQPDETLGHFADWLNIPTQELRNLNGLGFGEEIHVAHKIEIVFRNVTEKQFTQKRMEFHRTIEEDFFATFKINEVKIHKIQKGDNIWNLCKEVYDIPYWLVLKYNPEKDLRKLRAGDLLLVPRIEILSNSAAG